MKTPIRVLAALFILLAGPAQAEIFGLANGRTANVDSMSQLSVEAGANLGGDINHFGTRINFKVNPDLMMFGDLGRAGFYNFDGFVFGVGAFYQLREMKLIENTDFAVKASFHTGNLEWDACRGFLSNVCKFSAQEIAVEGLISGDQLGSTELAWYASAGLHILEDNTEIGITGGVVGKLSFGEWYAGAEMIDKLYLTAGVRYNVN